MDTLDMPFKCSDHVFICLLAFFSFRALQIFNDSRFGCTLTTSRWRLQECFLLLYIFFLLPVSSFQLSFSPLRLSEDRDHHVFLCSSCLDFAPFGLVSLGAADLEDQAPPWCVFAALWQVPWRLDGEHGSHQGRASQCGATCWILQHKKYLLQNVVYRQWGSA